MPRAGGRTADLDAKLLAEREADPGHGHIKRIAAKLGLSYGQAYSAFLRLDGKRKSAFPSRPTTTAGRVCRCGKPVLNDEATDYRFCAACRDAARPGVARFLVEARQ